MLDKRMDMIKTGELEAIIKKKQKNFNLSFLILLILFAISFIPRLLMIIIPERNFLRLADELMFELFYIVFFFGIKYCLKKYHVVIKNLEIPVDIKKEIASKSTYRKVLIFGSVINFTTLYNLITLQATEPHLVETMKSLAWITQISKYMLQNFIGIWWGAMIISILFLPNKISSHFKLELFHADEFFGFREVGKLYLIISVVIFAFIGIFVLWLIFSGASTFTKLLILIILIPWGIAIFFYPDMKIHEMIMKEKNLMKEKINANILPYDRALTEEKELMKQIYNFEFLKRVNDLRDHAYDVGILKKLFLAAISPVIPFIVDLVVRSLEI
ncbi:MAG: hypothetical protein ACFFCS_01860 [Candidatus Hodarchaeota archaeon]